MYSLIELTAAAVAFATTEEERVANNMICHDGGLTLAGSDAIAANTHDLRDVLSLLVNRVMITDKEFKTAMCALAYPGWEDEGEMLPTNHVAEHICLARDWQRC